MEDDVLITPVNNTLKQNGHYFADDISSSFSGMKVIIPPLNEVERGVYWNEIVRLSVCTPKPLLTLSRVQFFSDRGQTW